LISASWKLEGAVGDCIMHHHDFEDYSGDHIDVLYSVAAANRFASISEIGFSGDRYPEPLPPMIWDTLDVSRDIFDEIEENVNGEIDKAEVFLKIGRI